MHVHKMKFYNPTPIRKSLIFFENRFLLSGSPFIYWDTDCSAALQLSQSYTHS